MSNTMSLAPFATCADTWQAARYGCGLGCVPAITGAVAAWFFMHVGVRLYALRQKAFPSQEVITARRPVFASVGRLGEHRACALCQL
jgi:hypothetical protein